MKLSTIFALLVFIPASLLSQQVILEKEYGNAQKMTDGQSLKYGAFANGNIGICLYQLGKKSAKGGFPVMLVLDKKGNLVSENKFEEVKGFGLFSVFDQANNEIYALFRSQNSGGFGSKESTPKTQFTVCKLTAEGNRVIGKELEIKEGIVGMFTHNKKLCLLTFNSAQVIGSVNAAYNITEECGEVSIVEMSDDLNSFTQTKLDIPKFNLEMSSIQNRQVSLHDGKLVLFSEFFTKSGDKFGIEYKLTEIDLATKKISKETKGSIDIGNNQPAYTTNKTLDAELNSEFFSDRCVTFCQDETSGDFYVYGPCKSSKKSPDDVVWVAKFNSSLEKVWSKCLPAYDTKNSVYSYASLYNETLFIESNIEKASKFVTKISAADGSFKPGGETNTVFPNNPSFYYGPKKFATAQAFIEKEYGKDSYAVFASFIPNGTEVLMLIHEDRAQKFKVVKF